MDPRPSKNIPWLTPYLAVRDAERSIQFYRAAFGFSCSDQHVMRDDTGTIAHVEMYYPEEQLVLMFAPESSYQSTFPGTPPQSPKSSGAVPPFNFYVYHPEVDQLFQRALAAGAQPLLEPADQFWGDRFCLLEDIDGYRWGFAQKL